MAILVILDFWLTHEAMTLGNTKWDILRHEPVETLAMILVGVGETEEKNNKKTNASSL